MIEALRRAKVFSAVAKPIVPVDVYGFVPCDVSRPVRGVGSSMVLGEVKLIVLAGCAAAATIPSMNLSSAISVRLLYGIGLRDSGSLTLLSGFLLSVAFLASYILIRRAQHVGPALALRYE